MKADAVATAPEAGTSTVYGGCGQATVAATYLTELKSPGPALNDQQRAADADYKSPLWRRVDKMRHAEAV